MKTVTRRLFRHATPPAPADGSASSPQLREAYPIVNTPLQSIGSQEKVLTMPGSTASGTSFLSKLSQGSNKTYKCTVQLLDDSDTVTIEFKKHDAGQLILDKVCEYCQITEKDYFGLRYMDLNKHRYWIDPLKPIVKQVHGMTPIVLCLRVKYYPADPTTLSDELTRYQLFLQLRRDMLHGRLYCPQQDAAYLGACVLQSELGDYNSQDHHDAYVSEYKLFLKQTPKLEDRVAEIHKYDMSGKNPAEAELAFLQRACTMDTYGFDPYTVREYKTNNNLYLGCTATGILIYHLNRKLHHIPWADIEKIDYVGKELRIYPSTKYVESVANGSEQTPANLKESKGKKYEEPLRYHCPSATFAKHLWKYALWQKIFFTNNTSHVKPVTSSSRVPFLRGAKFRYSGRVLHEIQEEKPAEKEKSAPKRSATFVRYHVERQPGRAERTYDWMVGKSATLPRAASKDSVKNHIEEVKSVLRSSKFDAVKPDLEPPSAEAPEMPTKAEDNVKEKALKEQLDLSPTVDLSPSVSQYVVSQDESRPQSSKQTTVQNGNVVILKNGEIEELPAPIETIVENQQPSKRDRGIISTVLRTLLFTLLLTALFAIVIVSLEEAPYASVQNALSKIPRHTEFRTKYYDPYRMEALAHYNKLKADYYGQKTS